MCVTSIAMDSLNDYLHGLVFAREQRCNVSKTNAV